MEDYVICPHCKRKITNNPVIDAAAKGEGQGSENLNCECGEMMTYWDVAAQLRGQKTLLSKIQNWWQGFSKKQV